MQIKRNIPEGVVPLQEGAQVLCKDDSSIGTIERVLMKPEHQIATHLVVSHGLLSKERKLIPTHWIEHVSEEFVRLKVESRMIDKLPPYSPPE